MEQKNVIDRVSNSSYQLTFKILPLVSFGMVLKKNTHSYLKRILNYSSLFQLYLHVRPEFLHVLQPIYLLNFFYIKICYLR